MTRATTAVPLERLLIILLIISAGSSVWSRNIAPLVEPFGGDSGGEGSSPSGLVRDGDLPGNGGLIGRTGIPFDTLTVNPSSTFERPFGTYAPWNVPISWLRVPVHPESDLYAQRLWDDAATTHGDFDLMLSEYTYPVYETGDATGLFPATTDLATNLNGKTIPWNPAWVPALGTDAQAIVIDPPTGREWDLFKVSFDGATVHAVNGNLVQEGELQGDGSRPGNYWKKENGYYPSRGCGIQYLAMLVRPEEIAAGEIQHALSMQIRNTDGELFVPPATKLEHPENPPGVPEGMRFALNISDGNIEAWIESLPPALPETTRNSARIIARALRDYGWFVTDTAGSAQFQFEDRATAEPEWDALGLDERVINWTAYPRHLLHGLITRERIYAIVPSDEYPKPAKAKSWTGY